MKQLRQQQQLLREGDCGDDADVGGGAKGVGVMLMSERTPLLYCTSPPPCSPSPSPVALVHDAIVFDHHHHHANKRPFVKQPPFAGAYGPMAAFALVTNALLGVGVLILPYAFHVAGVWMSSMVVVFFTALLSLTAIFVVEVCARFNGRRTWRAMQDMEIGADNNNNSNNGKPGCVNGCVKPADINVLGDTVPELTGIAGEFGGHIMRGIVTIALTSEVTVSLWLYTTTFTVTASSVVETLLAHLWSYHVQDTAFLHFVVTLCFGAVCLLLTIVGISSQARLQMFLTIYRLSCFSTMAITVILAWLCFGKPPGFDAPFPATSITNQFAFVFASASFALCSHYILPHVLTPLRPKNRKSVLSVAGGANLMCGTIYVCLGMLFSSFFGSTTKQSIILNWRNYGGLFTGWTTGGGGTADWTALPIIMLVQLYPMFAVLSDFPILATPLVNTLWKLAPKKTSRCTACVIACLVPVVASSLLHEPYVITTIDGVSLFTLLYFTPICLWLLSQRSMQKEFGPGSHMTAYSGFYSRKIVAVSALLLSVFFFLFYIHSFSTKAPTKI